MKKSIQLYPLVHYITFPVTRSCEHSILGHLICGTFLGAIQQSMKEAKCVYMYTYMPSLLVNNHMSKENAECWV